MSSFVVLSELTDLYNSEDTLLGNGFGEQGGFPIENTKTTDITELWLSAVASGGTGVNSTLTIDLGSSPTWNLFVIANHTIPSVATITLKSGTTSGALDHTDAITWRAGDMYLLLTTARTDRYLILAIVDATLADGSYLSAGRILVGNGAAMTKPFQNDWEVEYTYKTRLSRSELATKNVDLICEYLGLSFNFIQLSDSNRTELIGFLQQQKGPRYWFFLIPDSAVYDGYIVRHMSQLREAFSKMTGVRRSTPGTVVVEEESRGIRLGP